MTACQKVEVQEALPPAGVIGAEPLTPCAAALSPQTSLRVRSTEDEDSPKGYRSPKPATHSVAGRKALFAGNGGQLEVFRQTESMNGAAYSTAVPFVSFSSARYSPASFSSSARLFSPMAAVMRLMRYLMVFSVVCRDSVMSK